MALQPVKAASSLISEFKAFALKGNVVDLAVGVIIGAAFGKIVDSLVKDIIMPAISLAMPADKSYTAWAFDLGDKTVPYGKFLGEIVNFVIVALALWIFTVKFLGFVLKAKKQEEAAAPPALTKDQELLTEIRDLLKSQEQSA